MYSQVCTCTSVSITRFTLYRRAGKIYVQEILKLEIPISVLKPKFWVQSGHVRNRLYFLLTNLQNNRNHNSWIRKRKELLCTALRCWLSSQVVSCKAGGWIEVSGQGYYISVGGSLLQQTLVFSNHYIISRTTVKVEHPADMRLICM